MAEEDGEARRKQLEQDEEQGKRLEDLIHRYAGGHHVDARCGAVRVSFLSANFNM